MAVRVRCRHPDRRETLRPRFRLVACLLIALIAVTALTSAATGAKREPAPNCTWGASSVRAEVVDGQIVVGQPTTSGCIP